MPVPEEMAGKNQLLPDGQFTETDSAGTVVGGERTNTNPSLEP